MNYVNAGLVCLGFYFQSLVAQSNDNFLGSDDYQITLLLPIRWTANQQSDLSVTIPDHFISIQPFSSFQDKNSTMIEFIPKGESSDHWSEIITVNKYIGQKIEAIDFVKYLKKILLKDVQNGLIWEEEFKNKTGYQQAILGLNYDLNEQHEVFKAHYYSGPNDCAGVQYTIRVKKEDLKAAQEKVDAFFKNHVRVTQKKSK